MEIWYFKLMPPLQTQKQNSAPKPQPGFTAPKNRGPLKSLRTFQGDMAETLQKTGGSVASVAMAEQKKKERENPLFLSHHMGLFLVTA